MTMICYASDLDAARTLLPRALNGLAAARTDGEVYDVQTVDSMAVLSASAVVVLQLAVQESNLVLMPGPGLSAAAMVDAAFAAKPATGQERPPAPRPQ